MVELARSRATPQAPLTRGTEVADWPLREDGELQRGERGQCLGKLPSASARAGGGGRGRRCAAGGGALIHKS